MGGTSGATRTRARRNLKTIVTMAVLTAATVPFVSSSGAAPKPISVVDYAQCANGQPPSEDVNCSEGWINGILQASNSHFREGDVTPQRLIVNVNTASGTCSEADTSGCHSVTLQYQARKGNTHAYDSLATWNTTVTDADRCQGLTTSVQNAIGCSGNPTPSTLAITEDPTDVGPSTADPSTSEHDLDGQHLEMYGSGTLVAMTVPSHDNAPCANDANCTDDYATTTIYYSAPRNTTVQLLFGGHLAVSPVDRGGWGDGLGAANINGGPYHIKWSGADGTSVGNRDNQIMGSAIEPLVEISTSASPQTATIGTAVNLSDTVTLTDTADPTGATTFQLHGPFESGDPITCDTSNAVSGASGSVSTYEKSGGGTGLGTWTGTLMVNGFTFGDGSAGDYYWVATFAGDSNNDGAGPEGCGVASEKVTVSLATPTGSTTIRIGDSVTVSGVTPTGNVSFFLYKDDATCSDATKLVYSEAGDGTGADGPAVTLSGGSASTAGEYSATTAGTYRWLVTYSGDGSNAPATVSNCVEVATIAYPA